MIALGTYPLGYPRITMMVTGQLPEDRLRAEVEAFLA